MRRAILLLAPLLAACGGGGGDQTGERDSGAAVQTAELTGLYQGRGEGEQRDRMCMVSQPSAAAAFGIVIEGPNGSCGGAGEAVLASNRLRLAMAGDEQCVIEAKIEGTQVTFPSAVPEGCAYYCAPGATLAGASFDKTGGTAEEAMRAMDLAGDPLCR